MSVDINWDELGFSYMDVKCHIRYVWRDGQWDGGTLVEDPHLNIHVASTALHYGQAAFEGLKAFAGEDGQIRLFRPDEHCQRMARAAQRICMAQVPEEMFMDAIRRVVDANRDYVPPYGTGGSLYIRPLLIGTGPRIGISPADEYVFIVLVLPVGAYYKAGLKPVRAVVLEDYDRAAPQGVGHVKVAGNYAASLEPHNVAQGMGFPVELYLDAREHRYIEEFGTSNFVGITADGRYVTSKSASILPSITNMSLQQLASDMGMPVEVRPVLFDEVEEFVEIGACGTAVVLTPVCEIVRGEQTIHVGPCDSCGPVLQKLYDQVRSIQCGEVADTYGWTVVV